MFHRLLNALLAFLDLVSALEERKFLKSGRSTCLASKYVNTYFRQILYNPTYRGYFFAAKLKAFPKNPDKFEIKWATYYFDGF